MLQTTSSNYIIWDEQNAICKDTITVTVHSIKLVNMTSIVKETSVFFHLSQNERNFAVLCFSAARLSKIIQGKHKNFRAKSFRSSTSETNKNAINLITKVKNLKLN